MSEPRYTYLHTLADLDAHQDWLPEIFAIHKQLRPAMNDFTAYEQLLRTMMSENQRLLLVDYGKPPFIGIAMFNMHHNTYQNKMMMLEDLVIDESLRGSNIGSQVLSEIERFGRENGCEHLGLDSGVYRGRAHKFYFLHGYVAESFHFTKAL